MAIGFTYRDRGGARRLKNGAMTVAQGRIQGVKESGQGRWAFSHTGRNTSKTNAFQTMRERSESRGSKRAPEHAAERDVKLDWIETLTADFPGNFVHISSGS